MLPTGVFLTNKKGYPVLSARHQAALKALVARHGAQVMVSGPPAGGASRGLKPYQQCVDRLQLRLQLSAPLADDALRAPPSPLSGTSTTSTASCPTRPTSSASSGRTSTTCRHRCSR